MPNFDINLLNNEEKFALLFGIMLWDGCLSHYFSKQGREYFAVCVTGHLKDDFEFFKSVLIPLMSFFRQKPVNYKLRLKDNTIRINICGRRLFNKINSYGFPIGKKGTSIFIPKFFYERKLLKYVVQGFFATDGSLVLTKNGNKFYPRIEGTGISNNLIRQLVNYLNNLGLVGYFYEAKRKKINLRWNSRQQPYRFQFNGKQNLIMFKNLVGFVNPKHEIRYNKFLKYSDAYDNEIKGISSKKQRALGEEINKIFYY